MWTYNGSEFTSEHIDNYIGFVYMITDLRNGKKYIGKKNFHSVRKLPPLKGKTRKRTKKTESDWQSYYGSNDEVKLLVEEHGGSIFKREILHLCSSKGELSYMELKEQVDREVLLRDDYYNGIIQARINASHLKTLWKDNDT